MLMRFEVENYKNFKDKIVVDFTKVGGYQFNTDCLSNNLLGKMIIYGRNAVGKTNLGEAIMDIYRSLCQTRFPYDRILNVESSLDYVSFLYEFSIDGRDIVYKYSKFENCELRDEMLYVDGTKVYSCDANLIKCEFNNLHMIQVENIDEKQYQESAYRIGSFDDVIEHRISVFRYILSQVTLARDSLLRKVADYIRGMAMFSDNISIRLPRNYYSELCSVFEKEDELEKLENFFCSMGIDSKFKLCKLPDGKCELYFVHDKLISFYENASIGTMVLFNVYSKFLANRRKMSFLYIDEFDAFYHYEMSRNLIMFLKQEYPECQVILTTHNTNLMTNRLLRPDCLFILSSEGKLTALCDATERELREGHNLEKMYISGEFAKYE